MTSAFITNGLLGLGSENLNDKAQDTNLDISESFSLNGLLGSSGKSFSDKVTVLGTSSGAYFWLRY